MLTSLESINLTQFDNFSEVAELLRHQRMLDSEINAVAEKLQNSENMLVLREKQLEVATANQVKTEEELLKLRDILNSEIKMENASKVAQLGLDRLSAFVQELREKLDKQHADLVEFSSKLSHYQKALEAKEQQQEEFIADLRTEVDTICHNHRIITTLSEEGFHIVESEIMQLKNSEDIATKSLGKMQENYSELEEKLINIEKSREQEQSESERMRCVNISF
ncbi:hypothetical protein DICVIV_03563 [Dictyocaulus viviparus]|uniref:Uncharacterized protein n=1 Tax=Dictyocaulus viviparus TaxID=29172 RepID=A0A0D8Y0R8_DICVI|nr:hypothetical protein DICVIV_03563 [Dictyocaulus viviparus]